MKFKLKHNIFIALVLILFSVFIFCSCEEQIEYTEKQITSEDIKIEKIMNLSSGQDGAIYNDFIFNFSDNGKCYVYSLTNSEKVATFMLDKTDMVSPHANSVCFSSQFYDENDEFPLIYINVYKNYRDSDDRREGMCCVYRIQRNELNFSSTLVQILQIDFIDNLNLWKSLPDNEDIRPYGNFVVDSTEGKLYAYVMRDKEYTTRFFEFNLPNVNEGDSSVFDGVNYLKLYESDIISYFDCIYFSFVQGCAYGDGKIFSIEGFFGTLHALRIIDLDEKRVIGILDLTTIGLFEEPELIEYHNGKLYYADSEGSLYSFELLLQDFNA